MMNRSNKCSTLGIKILDNNQSLFVYPLANLDLKENSLQKLQWKFIDFFTSNSTDKN